ncbi:hypothetical protein AK830_g12062 [Neonectria ditissima]|uniref:Uncharacterized protein n=1 Tax=Neonectria ditissima TaxID=78410 RepID=A0A0P7B1F0_9HYPO|nr:hypothetical protein AK830_g12062 [Neonectria ditissima]
MSVLATAYLLLRDNPNRFPKGTTQTPTATCTTPKDFPFRTGKPSKTKASSSQVSAFRGYATKERHMTAKSAMAEQYPEVVNKLEKELHFLEDNYSESNMRVLNSAASCDQILRALRDPSASLGGAWLCLVAREPDTSDRLPTLEYHQCQPPGNPHHFQRRHYEVQLYVELVLQRPRHGDIINEIKQSWTFVGMCCIVATLHLPATGMGSMSGRYRLEYTGMLGRI